MLQASFSEKAYNFQISVKCDRGANFTTAGDNYIHRESGIYAVKIYDIPVPFITHFSLYVKALLLSTVCIYAGRALTRETPGEKKAV